MNGSNFIQPLESRTLFSATPVADVNIPGDSLGKPLISAEHANGGGQQAVDSSGPIGSGASGLKQSLRAPQFREMASQID